MTVTLNMRAFVSGVAVISGERRMSWSHGSWGELPSTMVGDATPALRQVVWPAKFRANSFGLYDGTTNPQEFLKLYSIAMVAAGGDDKVMTNWFPWC
jgi:hypothetical protein